MRIIAGEKRSRVLTAPEGDHTRPTADRVREAIFNILGGFFDGESVLDLYAGSGALALEALSRGAGHAVLSDADRKAYSVILKNASALGYEQKTRVLNMKDEQVLAMMKSEGRVFDLVFLDPPYRMDTAPICAYLVENGMLSEHGRIVIEHRKETPPAPVEGLCVIRQRFYGITGVTVCAKSLEEGEK